MADITTGGFLSGKKTYITAITGILGAVGLYLTGDANIVQTFQTIVTMGAAIFLRNGIASVTTTK